VSEWWICPRDNQVTIDDASIMGIDCSRIPKNIYLIWWYPHSGHGEILYKHSERLPVREPFTDFSPYVGLFNGWMRAALDRAPPISLRQAKFVKSRMVDALAVRRGRESGRDMQHKHRIESLQTIEDVIDYDIMKGWD
jgi:hypothetical protein